MKICGHETLGVKVPLNSALVFPTLFCNFYKDFMFGKVLTHHFFCNSDIGHPTIFKVFV